MGKFSQNLIDLTSDQGLSLKRLSKKVDISSSLLYRYAIEERFPTIESIIKLANYFNCSINFLVGLDDEPSSANLKSIFDSHVFLSRYNNLITTNNLSHYALSKKINISENGYSVWQKGSMPYLDTLIKLADFFGVSIDYLVGRSDCP